MLVSSYITPKARKGQPSAIEGRGLAVAVAPITKDEIVAIKGSHIVDTPTLHSRPERLRNSDVQIAGGFHLVALHETEYEPVMLFINHSCEPNNANTGTTSPGTSFTGWAPSRAASADPRAIRFCRVVRAQGCEPRIRVAATRSGGKLQAGDVGTVEAGLWLRQPGQIAIPYRRSGEFLDLGSQFPASIASVDDRARLEQKHCGFGIGARAVLDAARDDEELLRCEHHIAISHLKGKPPVQDQEELVSVGMLMPGELALDLDDPDIVVVDLGNLLRRPLLSETRQHRVQIHRLHVFIVTRDRTSRPRAAPPDRTRCQAALGVLGSCCGER